MDMNSTPSLENVTFGGGILHFHMVPGGESGDSGFFDKVSPGLFDETPVQTAEQQTYQHMDGVVMSSIDIWQCVQTITTLCVNLALFNVIVLRKKLRRKKSHQFFLNLLLVHILLSVAGIISQFYSSSTYITLNNGLAQEMFFTLIITTCDRFVFIKYPFKHGSLTTRTVILLLSLSWIPSIVFVLLSFMFGISQFACTLMLTIIIPVATVVLTLSNINIYVMAKKHDAFIRQNCTPSKRTEMNMTKASWICFSIVATFILFWFPLFLHNLLALLDVYHPDNQKVFTKAVEKVAMLNSLIDPLLFIWLSRDTRRECKLIFQKVRSLRSRTTVYLNE